MVISGRLMFHTRVELALSLGDIDPITLLNSECSSTREYITLYLNMDINYGHCSVEMLCLLIITDLPGGNGCNYSSTRRFGRIFYDPSPGDTKAPRPKHQRQTNNGLFMTLFYS